MDSGASFACDLMPENPMMKMDGSKPLLQWLQRCAGQI